MFSNILINNKIIFVSIKNIKISKKINCHDKIEIFGLLNYEKFNNFNFDSWLNNSINIYSNNSNESRLIFTGFIYNYKIIRRRNELYCGVKGVSYTKQLDLQKNKRVFQDENKTFNDVLDIILKDYDKVKICGNNKKDENLNGLLIQDNITDWEFLLRLYKRFNTYCYINGINDSSDIYIGETEKCNFEEFDDLVFLKRDSSKLIFYLRNSLQIGNELILKDKTYVIVKIKIRYKAGEIINKYFAKEINLLNYEDPGNNKIKGKSLKAIVKENKDESKLGRVKIEFCDYKDIWKVERYFDIATNYSGDNNSNGVGFSFIPEINEKVLVYFPTSSEKDCFIIGSIKENTSSFHEDPTQKIIRNIKGRELRLNNDEISISSKDNEVKILLNDESIKIYNKNTFLTIKEKEAEIFYDNKLINLSSKGLLLKAKGGEIEISDEGLRLRGGNCEMKLSNDLNVKASSIDVNGTGKIDLNTNSNLNIKASKVNIN